MGVGIGATAALAGCSKDPSPGNAATTTLPYSTITVLQPGHGTRSGDHYLASLPDQVLWGYVPTVHAAPVLQMRSGQTITIDTVSHEGILEDQGRNPVAYFGGQGISEKDVLDDAKSRCGRI